MYQKEKNVLCGPPLSVPTIEVSSGQFLYERLSIHIDHEVIFLNEENKESITYRAFFEVTCKLSASLQNFGLNEKNIVAVCSENSIHYLIPVFAAVFQGIPVVLINPTYTEYELAHAFDLVQPDILFCSKNTLKTACNLRKRFPCLKTIIGLNAIKNDCHVPNIYDFISSWSSNFTIENYKPVDVDIDNRVALIVFSSGTTGLPKAVMLTHRNINTRRAIMMDPNYYFDPKSRVTLGILPFCHVFGLNLILTGLTHGRMIVVLEKFDPVLYLSCIQKYQIETIAAPPSIMQFLAKSPLIDKFDLSHVKDILSGSAPLSAALEEAVKRRIGVKNVRQGYSMTEGTATFVVVPPNTERRGSCGKLYPTVMAAVKDTTTGENLGPLKPGELCFKGNIIMKGYLKNELATKEAFTEDGFLSTGDIGYYDEDGYFYVIDRLKELIKYKGFQVAPAELEAILIAHPEIKDVAVVGVPDADAGELPMALVVRELNASLSEQEVKAYLSKYVSKNKHLHGGVKFVEEIPRNALGKVDRKNLKILARSMVKSKL